MRASRDNSALVHWKAVLSASTLGTAPTPNISPAVSAVPNHPANNAVISAEGWTPLKGSLAKQLLTRYLVYSGADGKVSTGVRVCLFITNTNSS